MGTIEVSNLERIRDIKKGQITMRIDFCWGADPNIVLSVKAVIASIHVQSLKRINEKMRGIDKFCDQIIAKGDEKGEHEREDHIVSAEAFDNEALKRLKRMKEQIIEISKLWDEAIDAGDQIDGYEDEMEEMMAGEDEGIADEEEVEEDEGWEDDCEEGGDEWEDREEDNRGNEEEDEDEGQDEEEEEEERKKKKYKKMIKKKKNQKKKSKKLRKQQKTKRKCLNCDVMLADVAAVEDHYKSSHRNHKYECGKCKTRFLTKAENLIHRRACNKKKN